MRSSGGRAFEHKRSSSTENLAFSGIARRPVKLAFFSFSLPKPPYACYGLHEQSCLIKNFPLLLFSMRLKVLTGGAPSRLFSLGFLCLILQVPTPHNVDSAPLCALQLIAGRRIITRHVHWPNTCIQDLWLYKLQLTLLL